jgi:polysaccharide biosynthesis protein PslH
MANKKILFILNGSPFPANSGGRMRTGIFIETLKEDGWEMSILFRGSQNDVADDWFKYYFKDIFVFPLTQEIGRESFWNGKLIARIQDLFDLVRGRSWEISRSFNIDFQSKVIDVINLGNYDFIFCRYISMAKYLLNNRKNIRAKVIVDLDDVEPIKIARSIRQTVPFWSYRYLRLMLNNIFFENYHKKLKVLDQCLVCSKKDKDCIEKRGWSTNVIVVPNSIDIVKYERIGSLSEEIWRQKTLLFCGALAYEPNAQGLQWFMENVWPIIRNHYQDVRLNIVGKGPAASLHRYVDNKSVFLYLNVPDILQYYQVSSLAIVPLHVAGGTRIKILEAFACRRPVVSTTIGAEGLDVEDGKHCLIADDHKAFADACCRLLNDRELTQNLTGNANKFVQQRYSSVNVRKIIQQIFEV